MTGFFGGWADASGPVVPEPTAWQFGQEFASATPANIRYCDNAQLERLDPSSLDFATSKKKAFRRDGRKGKTHLQTAASGAGSTDRTPASKPYSGNGLGIDCRASPRTSSSGERGERRNTSQPGCGSLRPRVADSWREFQHPRALGRTRAPSVSRGDHRGLRRGRSPSLLPKRARYQTRPRFNPRIRDANRRKRLLAPGSAIVSSHQSGPRCMSVKVRSLEPASRSASDSAFAGLSARMRSWNRRPSALINEARKAMCAGGWYCSRTDRRTRWSRSSAISAATWTRACIDPIPA